MPCILSARADIGLPRTRLVGTLMGPYCGTGRRIISNGDKRDKRDKRDVQGFAREASRYDEQRGAPCICPPPPPPPLPTPRWRLSIQTAAGFSHAMVC